MKFLKKLLALLWLLSIIKFLCMAFPSIKEPTRTSRLVAWENTNGKGNAEEQGSFFEGDIVLHSESRNGVRPPVLRWKKGLIPYKLSNSLCKKYFQNSL